MSTLKYVEIVDAKDSLLWYAQHIGKRFAVIREEDYYYWTREPAGYLNFIHKCDASVVDVTTKLVWSRAELIELIIGLKCEKHVHTTYDRDLFNHFKQLLIDELGGDHVSHMDRM